MALSDTAVQALKPIPGKRITKAHDRDGLFLHVSPAGTKSWVLRYRIHSKERSAALGRYPAVSLKKARERALEARSRLADGIDPVQHKRRQKAAEAAADEARFLALSLAWQKRQVWTPAVRKQYERLFERDINPALGRLPVSEVDATVIEALVEKVAVRGKVVAGHVLLLVRGVLSYAVSRKLIAHNPGREIQAPRREKGAKQSYPHLQGSSDVRTLLKALDAYAGTRQTSIALRLLLLTFARPSELREASWDEFDLDAVDGSGDPTPVWNIAPGRMKRRRPHVVPLSNQAVSLLRELHALTGGGKHLFPHQRRPDEPMARNTLLRALRDYMKLPTTAHGFRHLASTTLNSQGYNRDWIEMQLAHWREDVRGAYNKAQWLPERRLMMQGYADWIDRLAREPDNVVSIRKASGESR